MPHLRTGVGYYTWNVVQRLPVLDPTTTYVAWYLDVRGALRLEPRRRLFADVGAPNLVDRRVPIPASWFERVTLRFDVPKIEWVERFDVLFAPNFVPPPTRSRRVVLTVHDLAFRRFPETAPLATQHWRSRLETAIHRAAAVIVVSEQSRRDLLEHYPVDPERVSVVPLGVDTGLFRPVSAEPVRARYRLDGPYLLSLTGFELRKNLPRTIEAFVSLDEGIRPTLVLAGPVAPWNPEGWRLVEPILDALPADVRRRIVLTGYVSDEEKVGLLNGAEALVYPSLYEGFGLPVVEAMACGTPVLTSDVSALPDTAGDAALLVDPLSSEAIAHAMERLLTDRALRETLRERGLARAGAFSWDETTRGTADVLHRVLDSS